MACFQQKDVQRLNIYPPALGATYATEAECNQACQEGACCEGTTCTVKPACQCQGAGKTFKGVGTTCTGLCDQCLGVQSKCYCYCTSNGGKVPRFVNVTLLWAWATDRSDCSETITKSVTLSRMGTSLEDGFSSGGQTVCYSWDFTGDGFYVSVTSVLAQSQESLVASVKIRNTKCNRPNGEEIGWVFSLSSQKDKKTAQTGIGQGLCFDRHAGASESQSTVVDGWPANPPYWQGLSGTVSGTITINGFQE